MQDLILEGLKSLDIAQLIAMAIMFWFFYTRLDGKIEKSEERLTSEIEKVKLQVNRLSDKVEDIDRRLCRIEGSLATQGHCLFNQNPQDKKAE
jgi:hypothetical protein